MSTITVKQNILYGIGEGTNVASETYLEYALRWANSSYRDLNLRHRFRNLWTRSVFRMTDGQQTYQAPSDLGGFLTLKDETNDNILDQVTPEEFAREVDAQQVSDETFTSAYDTAVSLDNKAIVQYSETIADDASETTTYTRDTDYTMNYTTGTITCDSTGSMSDATTYYANYLKYSKGKPNKFALEFDASNGKYVFRVDPVPEAETIGTLIYPALPAQLSGTVEPIWANLEYALERGGIYFGSLEIIEDQAQRQEFLRLYEVAIQALIQLDLDLVPKHDRIPLKLRRYYYTDRSVRPLGNA